MDERNSTSPPARRRKIKQRLKMIEDHLGMVEGETLPGNTVRDSINLITNQLVEINAMLQRVVEKQSERQRDPSPRSSENLPDLRNSFESMREEVLGLREKVESRPVLERSLERTKIPEPKSYDGSRDAKALENFVWDLEHYFKVMNRHESVKVDLASMYLSGDAKLWWRSRMREDFASNRPEIRDWEVMKEELRKQFLPNNSSWIAREKLRNLKHTGNIREYVKGFMSLLLDITGMSEEDKLFAFISGLKPWAQLELRRQRVETLSSAIATAESLMDWKVSGSGNGEDGTRSKAENVGPERGKKRKVPMKKGNPVREKAKVRRIEPSSIRTNPGASNGCFICKGAHFARNCPKRQQLAALSSEGDASAADVPPRVGTLKLLNALSSEVAPSDGLLYCKVRINGEDILAMVDSGATHNFIRKETAVQMGLRSLPTNHSVKAVNSAPSKEVGLIKGVRAELGKWSGRIDLLSVPMDDFDLVLGNKFLKKAKALVAPHLGGVMLCDETTPCFIAGDFGRPSDQRKGMLSAMQLKKGVKHGEPTFLAALMEITPGTSMEVPEKIAEVLDEYQGLMPSDLPKTLPPRRAIDHSIDLEPGARPPAKAPYRMGPSELAELRKQLDGLLESGFIRPSKAPFGAPVLFQKKADGSLRMCVDYRALNKVTVKNKYPIPRTEDLFDRLSKATFFTKLDLRSGYWQVRIAEGDEAKTTCVTRYGSYEFLVMPFGLTNAPATFCNLMNDVLYDFLDAFCVVYLDDIVVYSTCLDEHVRHLRMVFERLKQHQLYIKREKCEFAQTEIMFLGHKISKGRVRMDASKVQAIVDWEDPKTVPDLRSFLGLANYYRKFIEGYSQKVAPLTDLLKKGKVWVWSRECKEAFTELKRAISTEPVLKLPNFDMPFEVHTDASGRAIGGVLVQEGHPVAFESRKLKSAEERYSAHEKEMLAVVHCLRVWRHYLLGTKFVVLTDNVANTFFQSQKTLSPKQARWMEFLEEYDFTWQHKPGRHNLVPDALSRKTQEICAALSSVESDFVERIQQECVNDSEYQKLCDQVKSGMVRRYWVEKGLLLTQGRRLYVPSGTLRQELLRSVHDAVWAGHPGCERTQALLERSYFWPKMRQEVEAYVKSCHICQQDKTERRKEAGLLVPLEIPEKPWVSVSMDFISGFPNVNGFKSVLVVVDRFSKYGIFIPAPDPCPAEEAAKLFLTHVVKYFGLPKDIVSDRDTRFTGRFWTALFKLLGSQLKFSTANHPQTDGQTERINALLEEYLRHYVSATQKNWLDLLQPAQFAYNLQKSSSTGMSPFELAMGWQPLTPHEIVKQNKSVGCPAAHRFAVNHQELMDEARDSLEKASHRMKKYADKGRRPLEFSVGDKVLLKLTPQIWKKISTKTVHRSLVPRYDGPFEVVQKVGAVAYRLDLPERLKVHPTFHVSYLKPYKEDVAGLHPPVNRNPPTVRKEFSKEIEKILDRRVLGQGKKNRRIEYLVQWENCPEAESSWERDISLWQFEDKVQEYLTRASGSSGGGGL